MERFVVGTGRCGSTVMAQMLSKHPDNLIISEFSGGPDSRISLDPSAISGKAFAEILSASNLVTEMMRFRTIEPKEIRSYISPTDFEKPWEALPSILTVTLPFLTPHPRELLDDCLVEVSSWPVRPIHDHYVAFFEFLQKRLNKKLWIERSGMSIEYLPKLYSCFPEGRYLHLHRDGRECALSMRQHLYFQLVVSFFADPMTEEELMQTEIGRPGLRPEDIAPSDPLRRRMTTDAPTIDKYGEYWSWQMLMGFKAFATMRPDQLLFMAFEDVLADPYRALKTINDWFELPSRPGWMDDAVAQLEKEVPTRYQTLSQADQEALDAACRPGRLLLGQTDSKWIFETMDRASAIEARRNEKVSA